MLAAPVVSALALGAACHDPTTGPERPTEQHAPRVGAPDLAPATRALQLAFLPPLGPPQPPRGIPDTTHAPSVTICRIRAASAPGCGADTLARFTRDPAVPDSIRVQLDGTVYAATWHTSRLAPDTMVRYRVMITLGDTVAGWADLALVPPSSIPVSGPPSDSGRLVRIAAAEAIPIRFQLLEPPHRLTTSVGAGVHGTPEGGVLDVDAGDAVTYRFTADSGYRNVLVTLDGRYVPAAGTVRMDRDHLLIATADRRIVVDQRDEALLRAFRALLRSGDAASAAQRLLDSLAAITDTANLDDRLERVALAAVDPVTDGSALRELDAALAGRVFDVGSGSGTPIASPPDGGSSGGGGGGIAFSRGTTRVRVEGRARRDDGWMGGSADAEEPVMIGYVNGILNTPLDALIAANHLLRAALAAPWTRPAPFRVRLIYNRSALAQSAPGALEAWCAAAEAARFTWLGSNSLPLLLVACRYQQTAAALNHMSGLGDIVEAAQQYASLALGAPPSLADARRVADSVRMWRQAGAHVLLVGHSQGNMMIQESVRLLATRGEYTPARDTTCIAAVSLAAPMSAGWPISDRHLTGLVTRGDIILDLGTNRFRQIDTPESAAMDVAITSADRQFGIVGHALMHVLAGLRLHDVVGSYLRQPPMRTAIQAAIVHGYNSCALGRIDVTPRQRTLQPGDRAILTADLRDVNGDPLDGTRTIRWRGETGTDWQRAVVVSPTGAVDARYVGGTTVTGTTRTRTGTGGVAVNPRPITASVAERLGFYWASLGLASTDADHLPDGLGSEPPGGTWDGGPCVSRAVFAGYLYAQVCTTDYTVTIQSMSGGTQYEATMFPLGLTDHGAAVSGATPSLRFGSNGPMPTPGTPGPPPPLIDRVGVRIFDGAGHLLGSGHVCVHGCVGWPGG